MGATACYKLIQQNQNLSRVIACELICAVEGLRHNENNPSPALLAAVNWVSERVPELTGDRSMSHEIQRVSEGLIRGTLSQSVRSMVEI